MQYDLTLKGFKTKEQALAFLSWFEGMGEQAFYDHLEDADLPVEDGSGIDVTHTGNTGSYWDEEGQTITARIK